jgi:general secretion pathway protein J
MAKKCKELATNNFGFTLLELLVSILLLSLIITIAYSALRVGSRTWEGTANVISENSKTRFALHFIRKKTEEIYPFFWKQGVKRKLAFEGSEEDLKFIGVAPLGRETNEYYEYHFKVEEIDNIYSIILYYEPHDPSADSFAVNEDSPNRLILDGLETVKFSYYGIQENNETLEWHDSWSDTAIGYPSLIQLNIRDKGNDDSNLDVFIEPRAKIDLNRSL